MTTDTTTRITDPDELAGHLADFIGTGSYYSNKLTGATYTDGVQFFAEAAGAYWLLDIIATEVQAAAKENNERFVCVRAVATNGKARLTADDGDGNVFWKKGIDMTDLPEGTWPIWLIDGVMLLPSEY